MRRREEGAVAVIVAIVLLVFVAAVALAVDVGGLMLHRRGLVNSSDAAALSAARTCARGGFDDHGSTEGAADTAALANSPITAGEVAGTNIIPMLSSACGATSGHVTVGYTSEQSLFFAPVLGFNHESPVHTEATASWGLGSNNAIPLVVSGKLVSTCPKPPPLGTNTIGQAPCGTWYDNDDLGNGNFGSLALNPQGWDTPPGECSGSGTNPSNRDLENWVTGMEPVSVGLNWPQPTYACNSNGLKSAWDEVADLAGKVRDFPITWDGCGVPLGWCVPPGSSTSQGLYPPGGGKILQYDVIGFAAQRIKAVYRTNDPQVQGTPSQDRTCSGKPNKDVGAGTYDWITFAGLIKCGGSDTPSRVPVDAISAVVVPGGINPTTTGITLSVPLLKNTAASFHWHMNGTTGICGPVPQSSSARCVVTEWLGSTLTGDYSDKPDNVRIIRLCDLAEGTCLDQ